MVNKKVVIICSIIALVIVGAIVGIKIKDFKDTQNEMNNRISESQISSNKVESASTISNENNVTSEENENEVKQEIKGDEETKSSETVKNETESIVTNTSSEEEIGDEVAINLVKNEWGFDDTTVYYTIDVKSSDTTYTISVRSKLTTEQLAEYDVNLIDKTVVIK